MGFMMMVLESSRSLARGMVTSPYGFSSEIFMMFGWGMNSASLRFLEVYEVKAGFEALLIQKLIFLWRPDSDFFFENPVSVPETAAHRCLL